MFYNKFDTPAIVHAGAETIPIWQPLYWLKLLQLVKFKKYNYNKQLNSINCAKLDHLKNYHIGFTFVGRINYIQY